MAKIYRSMGADISKISPKVVEWLRELDDSYSVLIEFAVGHVNCDFAILGPAVIAILEVKDVRNAIRGTANSHWTVSRTGYRLPAASVTGYATNPIGQAKKIGDTFSGYLRKHLKELYAGGPIPNENQLKAFPFVVIPRPHSGNQLVKNDDFCWIAQGHDDFMAQFKARRWPELRLSEQQQARIVKMLELEEVANPDRLFAPVDLETTPLWDDPAALDVLTTAVEMPMPEAWLKLGPDQGQPDENYALIDRVTILGRSSEADIQINFDLASRKHCQIEFLGNGFFIHDLSSHGTCLNGQRLPKDSFRALQDGSVIEITPGGLRYIFRQNSNPA